MKIFAVDENNDIYLNANQNLAIVFDINAVLEACEHAVKTLTGEMPYAANEGMPNFETIWNGSPNLLQFEFYFRQAVSAVEGVIGVTEFESEIESNVLKYTATIKTIYGEGVIDNGL